MGRRLGDVEARRKAIHIAAGFGPPVALLLFGWAGSVGVLLFLLAFVVAGGVLRLRGVRLPVMADLIESTRRPTEAFPLDAIEFLLVVLALGLVVDPLWFHPAIAVLSLGDGFAGLVGSRWGRHKLPWNRRKSWEGLLAGCAAAVAGAVAFALIASWATARIAVSGPLWSPWWAALVFLAFAYVVVVGGAALTARSRTGDDPARRASSVSAGTLVAVAALAVAALPGWLAHAGLLADGAVVPAAVAAVAPLTLAAAVGYGAVAAVGVMLVETVLRRHDNLVLPVVQVLLVAGLAWWDPAGLMAR